MFPSAYGEFYQEEDEDEDETRRKESGEDGVAKI